MDGNSDGELQEFVTAFMQGIESAQIDEWFVETANLKGPLRHRDLTPTVMLMALVGYAFKGFADLRSAVRLAYHAANPGAPKVFQSGTVTEARKRMPLDLLKRLFRHFITPILDGREPAVKAPLAGFERVLALDGTTFTTADTPANADEFGKPGSSRGESAWPHVRAAMAQDAASSLFMGIREGAYRTGEGKLIDELIEEFARAGTLIELDRGLYSAARIRRIRELGGDVLVRVPKHVKFGAPWACPDGSYFANVRTPDGELVTLRVMHFHIADGDDNVVENYRLATTVLDHKRLPADAAIAGYHLRWRVEGGIRELKWLRDRFQQPMCPGKSPASVRQEIWSMLITHTLLRRLMLQAALEAGEDPQRLSLAGAKESLTQFFRHAPALRDRR